MRTFLLHLAFAIGPLFGLLALDSPFGRVVMAALLFVSIFAFSHDAMHRALGLPRWANEIALSLGGVVMGVSGAAARALHMVHHARPGAADDFEGQGSRLGIGQALLIAPLAYLEAPLIAARRAPAGKRRRQIAEWFLVLLFFGVCIASGGASRTYAFVCLGAQLTIQVWGSHLPHRAPAALVELAKAFTWTRSPLLLSFAFHELHHRRADLSCFDLAERPRARVVGARSASAEDRWPRPTNPAATAPQVPLRSCPSASA